MRADWLWPRFLVAFMIAIVAQGAAAAEAARSQDALAPLIEGLVAAQDASVAAAVERIEGDGRKLLALRSYLRSSAHLAERWSWTAEQIAAYQQGPEYAALQAEIERVRAAFAGANPGYELWVNPQVRNLDIQIEHWNGNESVAAASESLLEAVRQHVSSPGFPLAKPDAADSALRQFLTSFVPTPTPTIAAPGLSPHGQMRAIDFQVHKGGAVVAGTRTSTIAEDWDGAGWTQKLSAAVRSTSRRFIGPLESPREPWHYTYTPEAVAAQ